MWWNFLNTTFYHIHYFESNRLGVLSKDGYCRPFDKDASGYSRAEAVSVVLLQKSADAKRIYADFIYSKTNNDGYKSEAITYPSGQMQIKLLSEFYNDLRIDPSTIDYVEAHSTGTLGNEALNVLKF